MTLELFTNSYITLEEANSFLESQSSLWQEASEEQREKALIQATTLLDNELWLSQSVSVEQLLAWPRLRFSYYDPSFNRIIQIDQGNVPRRLKLAVARQALHLLSYPSLFEESSVQDFERIRIGPIELDDKDDNKAKKVSIIPYASVRKLIEPLLSGNSSSKTWWRAF
jgi:hypothetical protein